MIKLKMPTLKSIKSIKFNSRVIYTFLSFLIVLVGTIAAIQYAKGNYRFTHSGFIKETGLLSANSNPTGAQVLINDKLVTATNDTLYLEPGTYQVKIVKDGYVPWEKTISIEKELVAQTSALLFPSAPSLSPLTFTGAENVSPSPDGQRLLFYTASASAKPQNGLYLLEMGNNLLPLSKNAQQLTENIPSWNLAEAEFIWAPDGNQVLLIANGHQVLLDLDKKQDLLGLQDVGYKRRQILSQWEEAIYLRERQLLAQFPQEIVQYATTSARNVYFSPDHKKLLYTAEAELTLPNDIVPPVPATNTQSQERKLEVNGIYVYDSQEDKNFRIGTESAIEQVSGRGQAGHTEAEQAAEQGQAAEQKHLLADGWSQNPPLTLAASPSAFLKLQEPTLATQSAHKFAAHYAALYTHSYQWHPDSRHVIHPEAEAIKIMEYDGTNDVVLYSGPFAEDFIYPWPDGRQLVIVISFTPDSPLNLYGLELKR